MSETSREMLYEGKAKKIFKAEQEDQVIIYYKDDTTAFNGVKKTSIENKGILNNAITSIIFEMLNEAGIETHYIKKVTDREQLCKRVDVILLEVIVRNLIAGSMATRLGIKEGTVPKQPIYELCYKNDDYKDPLINDDHAVALELATYEELQQIKEMTLKINKVLIEFFKQHHIQLVDLKLEFGKTRAGDIVLVDEISPDNCRLWDQETGEKLDKDRFRRDLGDVAASYQEILNRISNG